MAKDQFEDVEANVAPAEEPGKSAATPPAMIGTSTWVIVSLLLAIALGAFAVYRTLTPNAGAPAFYTLDVDTLIEAKRIQQEKTTDVAQYGASMAKFMGDTREIIRSLSQRGIVVIRADAVLSPVAGIDITQRVAEKLGLHAELSQVPGRLSSRAAAYQQEIAGASGVAADSPQVASVLPASAVPQVAASGASAQPQPATGASDASALSKLD
ncbi:hypothetical protein ACN8ZM_40555 (plasmid) [Burkholderia aenigmatica]|uniref:hypothetical protein n=1 Tax=Burkholderia aenigmatica TaxID=2015348 RepID=UPI003B42D7B8